MGYIGKEHDHESGYVNLGVRFYEPTRGLFAAPDPLWGAQLGNSAYHYGYNSPLMYSDPTGLLAARKPNMTSLDVFGGGDRESGWSNYDMMKLYWYFYDAGNTEEAQRILSTAKEHSRNMGYLGSIINPVLMDPVHVIAASDPKTQNSNWLWTHYVGPFNPLTLSGGYDYSPTPINMADLYGFVHDREYDALRIEGATGLLFSLDALPSDWEFVANQSELALDASNDPITRFTAGTAALILGTLALHKTRVYIWLKLAEKHSLQPIRGPKW